eukprot:768352-Hanusia_phi.AAC.4
MRVDGCNQCQPGYSSINGSYSVDFCQKSYCSNEPVRSDNSLQNAVNYYSSIDDTKIALWLDAKNVDGQHNDGLYRGSAYVKQWLDLGTNSFYTSHVTAAYLLNEAVWFNNISTYYQGNSLNIPMKGLTFFFVVRHTVTPIDILFAMDSSNNVIQQYSISSSSFQLVTSGGNSQSNMNYDRVIISGYIGSDNKPTVFIDGKQYDYSAFTIASSTINGYFKLGGNFQGYVHEVLFLNTVLSRSQITSVHLYLSKKWRISTRKMDSDSDGIKDYSDDNNNVPGCSECNPGSNFNGGTCRLCQKGKYGNFGDRCRWCTANALSPTGSVNSTSCVCDDGFYKTGGQCVTCPSGFWCRRICPIS